MAAQAAAPRPLLLLLLMALLGGGAWILWRVETGMDPETWRRALDPLKEGPWRGVWAGISDFGNGTVIAALILLAVSLAPDRRLLQNLLAAVLCEIVLTQTLKAFIARPRPDLDGLDAWPSGHSAITFALAFVIVGRPRGRFVALVVALAVGAARVLTLRHWPADVLGGFATGTAVALVVTRLPLFLPATAVGLPARQGATAVAVLVQAWILTLHPWSEQLRLPLATAFVLLACIVNGGPRATEGAVP